MKRLMMAVVFIILLAGCNSELTYREVNVNTKNKDVQEFINTVEHDNGAHILHDGKRSMYVFVNAGNVTQGSKATYFRDFNVEADGDVLKIMFHHETTDDYDDQDLDYQLLYKVKLDKKYDEIRLLDNEEETVFGTILN